MEVERWLCWVVRERGFIGSVLCLTWWMCVITLKEPDSHVVTGIRARERP